jgi:hypothetical protein
MLVQGKIVRFVTFSDYADSEFNDLFQEGGIAFVKVKKPPIEISELP